MNLEAIGNTAAASIVLALVDVLRGGVPEDGTRILLGAFGAGLTWCAGVLEWGVAAPGAVVMPRAEAATMVTRPLRLAG